MSKFDIKVQMNPVIMSILALLVSFIGLFFSYQANDLAKEQYRQSRLIVLKADFLKQDDTFIHVEPIDGNTHFIRGTAYLPPVIHKEEVPIASNGNILHMGSISSEIKDHFLTYVSSEKGITKISEGDIPVLIKSYYVSKGVGYTDISLYMLGMQVILTEEQHARPKIQFTSLAFIERYNELNDINYEMLDAMVSSEKGFQLPINKP